MKKLLAIALVATFIGPATTALAAPAHVMSSGATYFANSKGFVRDTASGIVHYGSFSKAGLDR